MALHWEKEDITSIKTDSDSEWCEIAVTSVDSAGNPQYPISTIRLWAIRKWREKLQRVKSSKPCAEIVIDVTNLCVISESIWWGHIRPIPFQAFYFWSEAPLDPRILYPNRHAVVRDRISEGALPLSPASHISCTILLEVINCSRKDSHPRFYEPELLGSRDQSPPSHRLNSSPHLPLRLFPKYFNSMFITHTREELDNVQFRHSLSLGLRKMTFTRAWISSGGYE